MHRTTELGQLLSLPDKGVTILATLQVFPYGSGGEYDHLRPFLHIKLAHM